MVVVAQYRLLSPRGMRKASLSGKRPGIEFQSPSCVREKNLHERVAWGTIALVEWGRLPHGGPEWQWAVWWGIWWGRAVQGARELGFPNWAEDIRWEWRDGYWPSTEFQTQWDQQGGGAMAQHSVSDPVERSPMQIVGYQRKASALSMV